MQGNLRAANRRSNNLYRFLMKINILACNEEKFLFFGLFFYYRFETRDLRAIATIR